MDAAPADRRGPDRSGPPWTPRSGPRPSAPYACCTPPPRADCRGPSASACSRSPTRRAASARPPLRSTSPPALALHGLHMLVIDLDPQGNASTALGIEHREGTPSSYEVLIGEIPLKDGAAAQPAQRAPVLPCRRPSTWPAPRSSWSAWSPARPGCAARSPDSRSTTSTTSSSTARRRWAC